MPNPMIGMIGGSIGSAAIGASAASKAADAQKSAAKNEVALKKMMFDQTSANLAPYLGAGNNAMAAVLYEMGLGPKPIIGGTAPTIAETKDNKGRVTGYGVGGQTFGTRSAAEEWANKNKTGGTEYEGYKVSPMANYLMEEGTSAIEGGAAGRGGLFSGATLQALEQNRRNTIEMDTDKYFSRLFGIQSSGQNAAAQQGAAASNYANSASDSMRAGAQGAAQGYINQGQAIQTGIGDIAGIAGYFGQQNNPMGAYTAATMRPQPNPFY